MRRYLAVFMTAMLVGCGPTSVKILPAAGTPAESYRTECLASTTPGSSVAVTSPDGKWEVQSRDLGHAQHAFYSVERGTSTETLIVVVKEGDAGSGNAITVAWSKDSQAVFLRGWGQPAGYEKKTDWALIYLVAARTLHDLGVVG